MITTMDLEKIAQDLRLDILRMFYLSGTGHMAPALSCVDIFTTLYFGDVISWDERFSEERDRVILSKGHACAALYAVLARAGYFPRDELLTFYQKNTRLGGHPCVALHGIETATGALGHGICFATGTALAAKIDEKSYRTYVVMGDGESQEGSVWEAAAFAANQGLSNMTVVVDCNGLQASTYIDDISLIEPLKNKWQSFGWAVLECSGHNFSELLHAFGRAKEMDRPTVILARTIKGKGVSFAENNPAWHSRAPKGAEWDKICGEYHIEKEELTHL